jgi:hypothetical protein
VIPARLYKRVAQYGFGIGDTFAPNGDLLVYVYNDVGGGPVALKRVI